MKANGSPCFECPERIPLKCHSECAKYKAYAAELDSLRRQRVRNFEIDSYITDAENRCSHQTPNIFRRNKK